MKMDDCNKCKAYTFAPNGELEGICYLLGRDVGFSGSCSFGAPVTPPDVCPINRGLAGECPCCGKLGMKHEFMLNATGECKTV
jgi:hypothetical protein